MYKAFLEKKRRSTKQDAAKNLQVSVEDGDKNQFSIPPYPTSFKTTIFVTGLPETIPNHLVKDSILKYCEGLRRWYRPSVHGRNSEYGTMGFAQFSSQQHAIAAQHVLNGLTYGDGKYELVATYDEADSDFPRKPKGQVSRVTEINGRPLLQLRQQIEDVLTSYTRKVRGDEELERVKNRTPIFGDSDQMDIDTHIKSSTDAELENALEQYPPEMRDHLRAEIKAFREEALRVELDQKKSNFISADIEARLKEAKEHKLKENASLKKLVRAENNVEESVPLSSDDELEVEELDGLDGDDDGSKRKKLFDSIDRKRAKERRDRKVSKAFVDSERRWIMREKSRIQAVARDNARRETAEERRNADRKRAMAKFDSDLSYHPFYVSHADWVKQRINVRLREAELDKFEEMAEENAKKKESELQEQAELLPAGKISIQLGKKADSSETAPDPDSTPETDESLFSKSIDWEKLDAHLDVAIRPFVSAQILDYLGVQEEEFVDFIMELLVQHKTSQEMIAELEAVLDEDSQKFVAELWKRLLQEAK